MSCLTTPGLSKDIRRHIGRGENGDQCRHQDIISHLNSYCVPNLDHVFCLLSKTNYHYSVATKNVKSLAGV